MTLNEKAATVVMGWEKYEFHERAHWADGSEIGKPCDSFAPETDWNDCMMVRSKAVERYAEWSATKEPHVTRGSHEVVAKMVYVNCIFQALGDAHSSIALAFATPAQITQAAISLVESMEEK